MTDERTGPADDPQDLPAPDAQADGDVRGGGGVIEDRSLSAGVLGDGSVRFADGSVRPPRGFSAGQDARMDSH